MTIQLPFSACVRDLRITDHELAELLNEHAEGHFTPRAAKLICDGRLARPAFAWSAVRQFNRQIEAESDKLLALHEHSGAGSFSVTSADLRNPRMRRILVRAMLKLEGGAPVRFSRNEGAQGESWGII